MKKTLYILLLIVSICLIIYSGKWSEDKNSVICNLGCGITTAAALGFLVDLSIENAEKRKRQLGFRKFFINIYKKIGNILGVIIWLYDKLESADFDWEKSIEEYFIFPGKIVLREVFGSPNDIKYNEAKGMLEVIQRKCDDFKKTSNDKFDMKTQKIFKVVSHMIEPIVEEIESKKTEELLLAVNDIISIDEIEILATNLFTAKSLMQSEEIRMGNYKRTITCLIEAYEFLRNNIGLDYKISISWPNDNWRTENE